LARGGYERGKCESRKKNEKDEWICEIKRLTEES
jgi:hypothetical protein